MIKRRTEVTDVDFSPRTTAPDVMAREIDMFLDERLDQAQLAGADAEFRHEAEKVIKVTRRNVWRTHLLGTDPPARIPPMNVELVEGHPPAPKPYTKKHTPQQLKFWKGWLGTGEEQIVIRKSNAKDVNPARLVGKPHTPVTNEWRVTVDMRHPNKGMKPEVFLPPTVMEMIMHLAHATVFATFDWLKGYWQIALDPRCTHLFAFLTPFGVYEFLRTVMGARNSGTYMGRQTYRIF